MLSKLRLRLSLGVVDPRLVSKLGIVQGHAERQIQGNSIDLTVKDVFLIQGGVVLYSDGRRELPAYSPVVPYKPYSLEGQSWYKLEPDSLYQIEFNETVKIPDYLCGITLVRSTMAKSGCSGENGLFDSGYQGSTGMMVSVESESHIEVGASIAQMIFYRSNARRAKYKGHYQGLNGPLEW